MSAIAESAAQSAGWLPYVVGVIVALLGGGGLAALLKSGREGSRIVVDAAQGAVIVQSSVMRGLREELDAAKAEIAALRASFTEITQLRGRVRDLEHDNELLRAENTRLTSRVRDLEQRTSLSD